MKSILPPPPPPHEKETDVSADAMYPLLQAARNLPQAEPGPALDAAILSAAAEHAAEIRRVRAGETRAAPPASGKRRSALERFSHWLLGDGDAAHGHFPHALAATVFIGIAFGLILRYGEQPDPYAHAPDERQLATASDLAGSSKLPGSKSPGATSVPAARPLADEAKDSTQASAGNASRTESEMTSPPARSAVPENKTKRADSSGKKAAPASLEESGIALEPFLLPRLSDRAAPQQRQQEVPSSPRADATAAKTAREANFGDMPSAPLEQRQSSPPSSAEMNRTREISGAGGTAAPSAAPLPSAPPAPPDAVEMQAPVQASAPASMPVSAPVPALAYKAETGPASSKLQASEQEAAPRGKASAATVSREAESASPPQRTPPVRAGMDNLEKQLKTVLELRRAGRTEEAEGLLQALRNAYSEVDVNAHLRRIEAGAGAERGGAPSPPKK